MAPSTLIKQLERIGQLLNRWKAEFRLTVGLALFLFLVFCLAGVDLLARYDRSGRFVAWAILLIVTGAMAWLVMKALVRRHSPEAVAVCVEQAFPQLDNHLINYLLFSASGLKDSFVAAYVRMEIPHWSGLDFGAMKDRRTLRRAQLSLGVALVLLLVPFPFLGRAWSVAMTRVLNPFADLTPVSMTHIVSVSPGSTTVLQGSSLKLSCQVEGRAGHEVVLDVHPADGELKTYRLGALKGGGEEGFRHEISKVTTELKYRFRAGDAYPPDWSEITLRPPLAFSSVSLKVVPPSYMGLPAKKYDAQAKAIDIPVGSEVVLSAVCNSALRSLVLSGTGEPVELERKGDAQGGTVSVIVTNGASFVLSAQSVAGDKAESTVGFNLLPDRPPVLSVKYPQKPVALPPGSSPFIDFSVSDDFGLGDVTIEQLSKPDDPSAPAKVLKTYTRAEIKGKEFSDLWKGVVRKTSDVGPMVLRVVVKDNRTEAGHVTVSGPLVFEPEDMALAAKKREELDKKNAEGLEQVIQLQRENITKTKQLQGTLTSSTPEQWGETASRQENIRQKVRLLLENGGGRSLGNLVQPVKKLYINEMAEVIPTLKGIPALRDAAEKDRQTVHALSMQEKILRQLTFAGESAKQAEASKSTSSLIGILDGIINGQAKIIQVSSQCATQGVAVAASVIEEQDALSSEVTVFVKACQTEAAAGQGEDKEQCAFLESVASYCEQQKITADMLLAAEQLEKNAPREAIGHERSAYDKLQVARKRFEEVRAQDEKEKREEMIEALQIAEAKLEKLKTLEKKLKEEMDKIEEVKSSNTKDFDAMEEEASEIKKNIEEAMLQIPRDLDIFAHLNVGNDLVEDVYSVFEEVTQEKGSGEKDPEGGPVAEKAVMKREHYLDAMEKAKELMDDFESWLGEKPDTTKVTDEAFDKEEMPDGVALTPLQTAMEDIIGDLLDIDESVDKAADDGAINQAVPDMEMGGLITEGDTTTFSAKGKSGNSTPDHKEQDGRSNVGRQGMASGESAAGSGTIGKGDENIEARRTKDPTQSGQVTADGEAKTKATGGGKLGSGKGDDWGDGGGTERMDATEAGSWADSLARMAKRADQSYAQASMKGLRTDSLKSAAHHIRQASDAVSKGVPIGQVAELRRKAIGALKKAKTELGEGSASTLDGGIATSTLTDVIEAEQDLSPAKYRGLNADYYKKLNEGL